MQMNEIMKYKDINGLEKITQIAHAYVRCNHLTLQKQIF